MNKAPTGTELARPFMPARDFDLSRCFYEALGFEKAQRRESVKHDGAREASS